MIFCAAFAPVLRALQARLGALVGVPFFLGAYMDDLVIIVPPGSAGQALGVAAEVCGAAHLDLHPSKSLAWSACGRLPALPAGLAARVDGRFVTAAPAPGGLLVAGVPVGAAAAAAAERVLADAARDCQRLLDMCEKGPAGRPRVESARSLLLDCLQLRLDFLSRVVDPRELLPFAAAFDSLIFDTFRRIYRLDASELLSLPVAQIHRPDAQGGSGVRRLAERVRFNFIDGAASAAPFIARATGVRLLQSDSPYEQAVDAATRAVAADGGPEPPCWRAIGEGRAAAPRRWGAKAYAEWRDAALRREQLDRARDDPCAAARVASASGPGALWLDCKADCGDDEVSPAVGAIVNGPALKDPLRRPDRAAVGTVVFPDDEARAIMRFRLGLFRGGGRCGRKSSDPKFRGNPFCTCQDATARHRVTCPYGPWAISRHNRLARLLQLLILEIPGATVRWTPRTPFWLRSTEPAEPDLRVDVPGWDKPLYIDVAVVFPSQGSAGKSALSAEADKRLSYPVWCAFERVQPVDFSPMVVEAFGRFGKQSARLIRRLAGENASAWGLHPGVEARRWFHLLGRRLQLDQADILINGRGRQ